MLATVKASIGLTPNSASPVLKTEITAQLDQGYPFTLLNTDFNATLQGLNDTTYEKPLYVMSVDDAQKTLKIKFNGAPSGNYRI